MSKSLMAWISLFGFLLPGCIGVYWLLAGGQFLPSHALQNVSYLVGVPIALVLTGAISRPLVSEARESGRRGKRMEQLGTLGALAFAPFLFFWIQHIFWVGGLMFMLHGVSPKHSHTLVEQVQRLGYQRYCPNKLELQGDSLLTPRQLCHVDYQFRRTLRAGDTVALSGQASRFGFKVESYTKVDATSNSEQYRRRADR